MENLRRLDPKWYTKGMIGETVLSNMEHYLFNPTRPDWDGFTRWAIDFGLNKREIILLIKEAKVAESLGEVT